MSERTRINITASSGAMAIEDPGYLLASQRGHLRRIALHIRQIADAEARMEFQFKDRTEVYWRKQRYRRPHQVFLIDGARGSGKTTLLLTLQRYLRLLGRPMKWQLNDPICDELQNFCEKIIGDDKAADDKAANGERTGSEKVFSFKARHELPHGERRTVWYLDVLFPTELETGQSILEGILATMVKTLEDEKERITSGRTAAADSDEKDSRRRDQNESVKKIDELIKEANEKVAKGWFLAKNAGQDAILQDSVDYLDFLAKKGEANVASFSRIYIWRDFVNRYLDHFRSELLAVFFDDTDVAPESTRDILQTIRIFLDHPRIVTIIAGNLRSMRQDMQLKGMEQLGDPIDALTEESESTAKDWRQFLRHQIEESLEKVMPRPYRYFLAFKPDPIGIPREYDEANYEPGRGDKQDDKSANGLSSQVPKTDFQLVFGMYFDTLCGKALSNARNEFLISKHLAHFRQLLDHRQISGEHEFETLEGFVSWWMFRHWYAEELRPRAVRHLEALKAFVLTEPQSDMISARLPNEHKKRLAVILFESPENHALVHRLSDSDSKVLIWIHRQNVKSAWRGDRYIEINERRIYERTYSYDYLGYRLDLGIGMPVKENPGESIPKGILPIPSGPNLIGYRPFFPRMKRQQLYGMANGMQHTLVPANCIYFTDISSLPDVAWADSTETAMRNWGAQVIYNWPNVFSFDNEISQRDGDSEDKRPMVSDVSEEKVRDYFVNVVLPFSSGDIGTYARTPNNHVDARQKSFDETVSSALLSVELGAASKDEPQPFFSDLRSKMSVRQRRLDFMSSFGSSLLETLGMSNLAQSERESWGKLVLDRFIPVVSETVGIEAYLASYQWLVNDVRRAWHAGRIFQNQTSGALTKASSSEKPPKLRDSVIDVSEISRRDTFARSDRYTIPTSRTFWNWLERSNTFTAFEEQYLKCAAIAPRNGSRIGRLDIWNPQWSDLNSDGDNWLTRHGVRKRLDGKGGWFFGVDADWIVRQTIEDVRRLSGESATTGNDLQLSAERIEQYVKPRVDLNRELLDFLNPALTEQDVNRQTEPTIGRQTEPKISEKALLENRTRSRLSRAFLFFLYGVSATLPSLIHIEVASALKSPEAKNGKSEQDGVRADCARAVLDVWTKRTVDFISFVQNYRRILEMTKLRLDIMTLCRMLFDGEKDGAVRKSALKKLTPERFGVSMALTPDVDFGTLGVDGVGLFVKSSEDRTEHWSLIFSDGTLANGNFPVDVDSLQKKWKTFSDDLRKRGDSEARSRPMISTTLENLVETLNFIKVCQARCRR